MCLALPTCTLFIDVSSNGWGAHFQYLSALGLWLRQEQEDYINNLEMKAVMNALLAFQEEFFGRRVFLMSDSESAVAYLNKQGRLYQSLCVRGCR